MEESVNKRYSKSDLDEFRQVIKSKIEVTQKELDQLVSSLQSTNSNGTDDTASTYKTIEDGNSTLQKESTSHMAARLKKFIINLENALVRIENGTYGVCRVTGKLISKERLLAVPHTTQSIEAKKQQYK